MNRYVPALVVLSFLLAGSCARESPNLAPVFPPEIGGLKLVTNPPAGERTWAFPESEDAREVAYTDASGAMPLRLFAFGFADKDAAGQTYETSRIHAETGTGDYKKAGERRYGGVRGLRLADDSGVYFLYTHGRWLLVLSGRTDDLFGDAVKATRWAPAADTTVVDSTRS